MLPIRSTFKFQGQNFAVSLMLKTSVLEIQFNFHLISFGRWNSVVESCLWSSWNFFGIIILMLLVHNLNSNKYYFCSKIFFLSYFSQFPLAIGWREKKIPAIIIKQQFGFPIRTTTVQQDSSDLATEIKRGLYLNIFINPNFHSWKARICVAECTKAPLW